MQVQLNIKCSICGRFVETTMTGALFMGLLMGSKADDQRAVVTCSDTCRKEKQRREALPHRESEGGQS